MFFPCRARRSMMFGKGERATHSTDATERETHLPDASAANRALELLGRELNLFTEKKEVGMPGDFDHMADEELTEFIEAQAEVERTAPPSKNEGADRHV